MIVMHPGEYIIEAYLEPLDISRTELSRRLGVSASAVSRILTGKSDISPEMAVRFERVLGRSAESWLAMQADYSLVEAHEAIDVSDLKPISA